MRRFDLLDDPLHLALPADHRLARRKSPPRLADLAEESFVQTSESSPCARHVVRSCHIAGFEPRVSFESDDYATVQGLVAAGVGVALIPQLALSPVRDDVVVRSLGPDEPVRKVFAATPRAAAATPAVATMLDVLRAAASAAEGRRSGSLQTRSLRSLKCFGRDTRPPSSAKPEIASPTPLRPSKLKRKVGGPFLSSASVPRAGLVARYESEETGAFPRTAASSFLRT